MTNFNMLILALYGFSPDFFLPEKPARARPIAAPTAIQVGMSSRATPTAVPIPIPSAIKYPFVFIFLA